MMEEALNAAAGWLEGLTYPKSSIGLEPIKYQWGVTQTKLLYSHAVHKDGTLFSVVRTTNKSIGRLGIYDFPFREEEAQQMLEFFSGNNQGTQEIGVADKLMLRTFGNNPNTHVFGLTTFDLPLAKRHLLAFRNDPNSDKPYGVRSTTVSLQGVEMQYAFFTRNDVSVMREALRK